MENDLDGTALGAYIHATENPERYKCCIGYPTTDIAFLCLQPHLVKSKILKGVYGVCIEAGGDIQIIDMKSNLIYASIAFFDGDPESNTLSSWAYYYPII